jgi:hypothetical protein
MKLLIKRLAEIASFLLIFTSGAMASGIVVSDYSGSYFITPQADGTFTSVPIGPQASQFGALSQTQPQQAPQGQGAPGTAVAPGNMSPPSLPSQQQLVCPQITCPQQACNCVCPAPDSDTQQGGIAAPSDTPDTATDQRP